MEYPFWKPDFNRASNYETEYPLTAKIFEQPNAFWLNGSSKFLKTIDRSIERTLARATPSLPVFVLYAITGRDLGQHSAGGLSAEDYLRFCKRIAKGIGDNSPILIYEPDALAHLHNMGCDEAIERVNLINEAIDILKTSKARIYLDVGHSNWLEPDCAVDLLGLAEIERVNGFAINVSNYRTTEESIRWGDTVAGLIGSDCHYVIDTSRNGVGPHEDVWCNPPDRAVGEVPSTDTASELCDAYLWIKVPGESDGEDNGGPIAGKFWPEMGETLIKNSPFIDND